MNSTSFLQARIAALSLTEHQGDILQAVDGFIAEGGLNIRQLKLHARHTRNRLAAAGIAVKLNHAPELVSCVHGFRDWQVHIRMRPITDSHSVPIIDSHSCRSAIRIQYRSAVI